VEHPPGLRPASGIDDVLSKRVRLSRRLRGAMLVPKFVTKPPRHAAEPLRRHVARQPGQLGPCRNGQDCVRRLLADSLNHLTVSVAIAAPSHP
jgi:hypothetical protein